MIRLDNNSLTSAIMPISSNTNITSYVNNYSPLDQFVIRNILNLDLLDMINLSFTNMSLYLVLTGFIVTVIYLINNKVSIPKYLPDFIFNYLRNLQLIIICGDAIIKIIIKQNLAISFEY